MGGKTGTTTSTTTIPPEVLARYNAVNASAEKTAATPFKEYSSDPNSFVAPLNQQQQTGISGINNYANAAQPSIAYAQQGYTPQGFQQGVQGYMNPYLSNAMGATAAQLNNVNKQQQNQLQGTAIQQGAFGGDRGNIAQAALMGQQNLALGSTLGNMASQGYQNAAQNYMTGLGQIGNLGIQGQQAGLQGAQAQLGAGTLGQQTTQAGNTALYNQFQQQQAYPFQVAQFLANIAEGTGALSGSSTTGTSPMPFFSDRRLKEDIKRVGTADNGLPIYKFKYKGDHSEQTHVGFMADEVEKVHPEAVGLAGGYKTVDYEKASEPVRHHNAFGGLNINPASTLSGAGSVGQTNQDPSILFPIEHGGTAGDHPSGFGVNHNYSPSTGEGGLMGDIGHSIGNMTGAITGDVGVGGKEGQAMYAHGGLVPSSMGGHVGTEHTGEGYAAGGYADTAAFGKYDPYDNNSFYNLLNKNQAAQNVNSKMRQLGGNPGVASHVPQANLPVGQLKTSGSPPPMPDSILQQGLGAANEIEQGGKLFGSAKDSLSKAYDYLKTLNSPTAQARGGLVGYASGGDIPYEDTSNDGKLDIPNEKNKHALMTDKNPTGSTSQTGLGLGQALALPGEISKLGSTASGLASGIGSAASGIGSAATAAASGIGDALSALPFLFLSGGGTVDREHHDGFEGNVVGDKTPVADPADTFVNSYWDKHVKQESGGRQFNADGTPLTSPKGAVGVSQVMPTTGPEAAKLAGVDWSADRLANDPEYNQTLGKAYLKAQYQKYQDPVLATAAYNAGPGNVDSALAKAATRGGSYLDYLPTETQKYVSSIHGDQKQSPKEDNNPLAGLGKMFGIGSAQAQEPQQQSNQQGGLLPQTGLFSEQTVIPLLSGLGAMASSRSPYLGAALLQGLGGGAKAYEDVRTQQMERQALSPVISQRNIATTNTLQTGLMQYNAMRDANGQPPISMQEFAKLSGYQGALPSDAQAVTGQTGVFGQPSAAGATPTGGGDQSKVGLAPAPTLQQMHSGTVVRDGVEIPLGNDPASLQAFVNKYKGVGGAGSFLDGQVKAYEDRLNDINASKLTRDVNGSSIPAMGVLAASRKAALAENVTKNIQSQYNDSTDFEKNYQFNNQLIDNIAEYSRLANMNRATPELAEAIGRLSSIPGFDKYITSDMATLQKANDSGTKSAVISALQTLAENSGSAQKSVLQEALHAVATPGINPGSRHDIVANAKAKLEQQHDLYQAWLAAGEKNNGQYPEPVSFTSQFNQTKPLKDYLEKAKKDIPAFAGQAQTEGNRTVVRTGVMQDGPNAGKKVIQYSDGSTEVQ